MSNRFQPQINKVYIGLPSGPETDPVYWTTSKYPAADSPETQKISGLIVPPNPYQPPASDGAKIPSSPEPDPCKAIIAGMVLQAGIFVGGIPAIDYYTTKYETPRLSTPLFVAYTSLYLWKGFSIDVLEYRQKCRGPSDPQGPGSPAPEPQAQPQPDSSPEKSTVPQPEQDPPVDSSWVDKAGWGLVGGVAALAAAAAFFIPFDGPVGELALGAASLAAFTKAGLNS